VQLYAQTTARRTGQLLGDLLLLGWVAVWALMARALHDATAALAAPGRSLERAGEGMSGKLRGAGESAAGVPVVGDELSTPIREAGSASEALAEAGREQQEAVLDLALLLGITTFAVPVALALLIWLPRRVRFARRATAARRFIDAAADLDLFALRALAHQPMHVLARISDDPAGAWRSRDEMVVTTLAELELRSTGLRLPAHLVPDSVSRRR